MYYRKSQNVAQPNKLTVHAFTLPAIEFPHKTGPSLNCGYRSGQVNPQRAAMKTHPVSVAVFSLRSHPRTSVSPRMFSDRF
ncbi:MAG: hypothetical protein Fues2KO_23990 [Fuerstiella sp.]